MISFQPASTSGPLFSPTDDVDDDDDDDFQMLGCNFDYTIEYSVPSADIHIESPLPLAYAIETCIH